MTEASELTHVKLILPIGDAYKDLYQSLRQYFASRFRLEASFAQVVKYLVDQRWFYETDTYLEDQAIEDPIFDELEIHDPQERRAYLGGFLRLSEEIRTNLRHYGIQLSWVQHDLIRVGTIESKNYTVIFFESVPAPKGCYPRGMVRRR